ncbi:MAG TPA: ABC transporter ATP-binding protein [Acidimicrobiales bacterium]|nr:ABC transporter ATP-binding protein [Acidimicrobiales bacterium]
MPPLLELEGVVAGYGRVEVLHGLDLSVPAGTIVALLGPNGVGKTTALRTIAGTLECLQGTIRFGGRRINGRPPHEIAADGLVLIPEGRGIFPNLDVAENLRVNANAGPDRSQRAVRLEWVMDHFPRLAERLDQRAGSLSGGEQQMLALTRAFLAEPRLLLVDEISMGLAPLIVEQLFADIALLKSRGVSILLVEQYMTFALEVADICCVMGHGRIDFVGEPEELRHSSVLSRAYLGN